MPRKGLSILENFNCLTPCLLLTVIDLSKIEYLALNNTATGRSLVLNDIPVAVFLAILKPACASQKHMAIMSDKNIV